MKRVLIGLIVVLAAVALFVLSTGARTSIQDPAIPKEGKDQPKKVTLDHGQPRRQMGRGRVRSRNPLSQEIQS